MKNIVFLITLITIAFSQFGNTIAGWYNDDYYIPSGSVYSEGLIVVDESTLAAESLDEGDFSTSFIWTDTGDFDVTGGVAAVFVWSANVTSTIETAQADLLVTGVSSRWYVFTYTLAVTTAFDGDAAATITTSFALTAVPLEIVTAGTYTLYFKSAVTPTDFVISIVSGSDTEGTISYDDVTLKEITGGDMYVAGTVNASTIFASGSFTLKTGTGTIVLTVDADGKLYMESDGTGPQITLTGKTDATADAIILLSAAGATNVQGLKLWYDRDTAYGYIDNLYNNDAGNIYFRTKTAGTPINALTILGTGSINTGTDFTIGSSTDDVQPTFSIVGDADSDAGDDVSETLTIKLYPNATPTAAYWGFSSTQTTGFRFGSDMLLVGSSLRADKAVILEELASQETIVAGEGGYWVRNDAPTKPMFTDDDGDDHEIRLEGSYYGVAKSHLSGNTLTIGITAQNYGVQGELSDNGSSGFTFVSGSTGPIASISTVAAGDSTNFVDVGHGLLTGDYVTINTVNHSGVTVVVKEDNDNFRTGIDFVGDEAGFWFEGDYLLASIGSDGVYKLDFGVSHSAGNPAKEYHWHAIQNATITGASFNITPAGANHESGFDSDRLTVNAGDRFWIVVTNKTDTEDVVFEDMTLFLHKL